LPLPFLSYGGSFLWTAMIAVGVILGIQHRWKEYTP
ncbi:MAG: FtsW/RodA/SpoVE family cell cycle protein, partial [Deltaproteobacteria bacterium]|nr:FtsW/RodA/SpoVE family cell cycle protein [Deltaproteobacteria bacterium]